MLIFLRSFRNKATGRRWHGWCLAQKEAYCKQQLCRSRLRMSAGVQALACHCSLKAVLQPGISTGRGISARERGRLVESQSYSQLPLARVIWLLLIATLLTIKPALANSATDKTKAIHFSEVIIGFDGHFKVGYWTPVTVVIENKGELLNGILEFETVDGDAVMIRYDTSIGDGLKIRAKQQTTFTAYAKFGRVTDGFIVRLRNENQVLAERPVALDGQPRPALSTSNLIVAVGNDIGVGDALKMERGDTSRNAETNYVVVKPEKHRLPLHWIGYESVDTLVLCTSRIGTAESSLGDEELRAIETWVKLGGRLLFCVDDDGYPRLESSGPLASLLPGEFDRTARLTSAAGLETFVAATQPLDLRRNIVQVVVLSHVRGTVDTSERIGGQTQPVIIRSLHGFGHVMFVAMNLDAPVLRNWADRPRLVAELLSRVSGRRQLPRKERHSGKASHLGYQDMTGQLRAALDQFEGVRPLAFSAIVAMIVLYIVLIGPGDYFLLKKFSRRMELTWLSLVILVAGFCGLVFMLLRLTQSDAIHVNEVEVIDIDAESGLLRSTSWTHVYSPSTQFYNLTYRPRLPRDGNLHDVLLCWNGLPGRGLNGMDTSVPVVAPGDAYMLESETSSGSLCTHIERMPIHTASSKTFLARWWASLDSVPLGELSKDPLDDSLRGELTNPLDVELSDCVVLFGNWAYRLDRHLAAGETVRIDEVMTEKTIGGFLNDRRVIESQDVPTPWDTAGLDVARIMDVMLFYKAAGGFQYTNLTLHYQNFVDMSDQIEAGRAVLFARAKGRFGQMEDNGHRLNADAAGQRHWTFVRVVLPVEGAGGNK